MMRFDTVCTRLFIDREVVGKPLQKGQRVELRLGIKTNSPFNRKGERKFLLPMGRKTQRLDGLPLAQKRRGMMSGIQIGAFSFEGASDLFGCNQVGILLDGMLLCLGILFGMRRPESID